MATFCTCSERWRFYQKACGHLVRVCVCVCAYLCVCVCVLSEALVSQLELKESVRWSETEKESKRWLDYSCLSFHSGGGAVRSHPTDVSSKGVFAGSHTSSSLLSLQSLFHSILFPLPLVCPPLRYLLTFSLFSSTSPSVCPSFPPLDVHSSASGALLARWFFTGAQPEFTGRSGDVRWVFFFFF